ncbi:MAG: hypothetical protein ACTSW1_16260 [Candidatus Hodarchaeales archaeon]
MADTAPKDQGIFEVKQKVSSLEQMMMRLLFVQQKTEMSLQNLHREMKDFKDEMKDFKDEMKDFKDEMKDFKDEMKDFKDEMKDFKDEMKDFKDEMNKRWGELANKMGTIVEDIVAPNIPTIAKKYFGCTELNDLFINPNVRNKKDRNKIREFDIIASFDNKVILNETKSTAKKECINSFIDFVESMEFYDYFPQYKGMELIPVFSSLNIKEDMIKILTKNNIYCLIMKGNTMDLVNYSEINKENK